MGLARGSRNRFRRLSALVLAAALAGSAPAQVPDRNGLPARLAEVETVMDRYYRGETPEAGHRRVNALVDDFNAQVERRNAEQDQVLAAVERERAAAGALGAALEAQDRALGAPPEAGAGAEAVRRYNERVAARNQQAKAYNAAVAAARRAGEAGQARLRDLDAEIDRARTRVAAEQQALKARSEAFEAFRAQERDLAFFTGLNRLLAEVRAGGRTQAGPPWPAALARVRGWRRELAAWAAARQAEQDNGLVLVPALVGDEPCCFIVDTGAQLVCLPREVIDALGLGDRLGEEANLVLAGGQKLRGRAITFPRVAAAGMAATQVAGTAVAASEVGIDGLLGQSFLKRFVYTVDESRPGKLILVAR